MHPISISILLYLIQIHQGTSVTTNPNQNQDQVQAESTFFPSESKRIHKKLKFPSDEEKVSKISFQTSASEHLDDIDEQAAIDLILAATKSGRSLDLGEGTEELRELTNDPKIKAEIVAGNDAQARNYIRNKLCKLGLMECTGDGIDKKQGFGFGGGHYSGGPGGIPFNDIRVVQPVAIKPIGHPISAVSLEPHKPLNHVGPPLNRPFHSPIKPHSGYGKELPFYGPPLSQSAKPGVLPPPKSYGLGPLPASAPIYGKPQPGPFYGTSGKIVEHIHHHIHHTPVSHSGAGTYGVIGGTGGGYGGGFDEYGAAQRPAISVLTPSGSNVGTFRQKKSKDYSRRYRSDDCTCVRINQCASYDIVQTQGSAGQQVIQGSGRPNSGLVGYNIDPRNKVREFPIESNATSSESRWRDPRNRQRRKREAEQKVESRVFGKLLGFEPTVGVSFGLPGGYPQYGNGYPLNPTGSNPLVNPYNGGGISLGPISVNPLVSFQKTKDKDKTKIFKPLVNLHITPNPSLLNGIKTFFQRKKAAKAHRFGFGHPQHVPVPVPVPVIDPNVQHHHQHYHHQYAYPQSSGYGWPSSYYSYPQIPSNAYGYGYKGWTPLGSGHVPYTYSQSDALAYANAGSYAATGGGYQYGNRAMPAQVASLIRAEPQNYASSQKTEGGGTLDLLSSLQSAFNNVNTNAGSSYQDEESALLQELLEEGEITQAELEEYKRQEGIGGENQVRRHGRTLFPSSDRQIEHSSRIGSEALVQESLRSLLQKRVLPTGNIETRLPVAATGPDAPHSNSDSKFFPRESGRLSFSPNGNRGTGTGRGRSRVTFPDEKKRNKRQVSARVLSQSVQSQRQLNLGRTCPNGYVCCRHPIIRPTTSSYPQSYPAAKNPNQFLNSFSLSQSFGQCGKRNARGITGRVTNPNPVNEGDTDYGEYPWQVAILKKDGYDNVYVCGGSIIDDLHVVTAAHCLKGLQPNDLRVRLGDWDVNHETEFYPHLERDVAGFALHPDFYAGNLFNDIAVMRLEGAINFRQNPHVSPICVPQKGTEFGGQRCLVTGWGKDGWGDKGKYQNVLKEVDVPVLRHFDCEQKLKRTRLGPDFVLHSGFVCAGGEEGKDACKGDGGGPLVCNVQGTFMLAGIVSWGVGCGHREVPGVYVKVSYYRDWLHETIKV